MSSPIEKFIGPVVAVQRVVGLFPVSPDLRFSTKLAATNFAALFILQVASVGSMLVATLVEKTMKPLSFVEFFSVVCASLMFMACITVKAPNIKDYISECEKIHDKLVNLHFRPKYPSRTSTVQLWIWALMIVPLAVSDFIIYDYSGLRKSAYLAYNVSDSFTHLGVLFFRQLTQIPTNHLDLVTRYVRAKRTAILRDKERSRLQNCTKIFHEIIDNCRKLSSCFALALLFVTAMGFNCMIIDGFNAVRLLTQNVNKNFKLPLAKMLSRIFWFSYTSYKLFILLGACNKIHLASKTFTLELRETIAAADVEQVIHTGDTIRTHHLLFKNIEFTAAGFYTLDFTLMLSILSAVGSYLVILIQFGATP